MPPVNHHVLEQQSETWQGKTSDSKEGFPTLALWGCLIREVQASLLVWWVSDTVAIWHAAAKLLQSCPTLCNPIDGSPPGSPVPGILRARTLEWVAISFSNAWKWKVKVKSLSHVWPLATPWTAAYQAPPSMGFSRQEYWSGVRLPSPNMVWQLSIHGWSGHCFSPNVAGGWAL